jgi:hypothetical protein
MQFPPLHDRTMSNCSAEMRAAVKARATNSGPLGRERVIDKALLLALDRDEQLLFKLIEIFRQESGTMLSQLKDAARERGTIRHLSVSLTS